LKTTTSTWLNLRQHHAQAQILGPSIPCDFLLPPHARLEHILLITPLDFVRLLPPVIEMTDTLAKSIQDSTNTPNHSCRNLSAMINVETQFSLETLDIDPTLLNDLTHAILTLNIPLMPVLIPILLLWPKFTSTCIPPGPCLQSHGAICTIFIMPVIALIQPTPDILLLAHWVSHVTVVLLRPLSPSSQTLGAPLKMSICPQCVTRRGTMTMALKVQKVHVL
jgi:hypothetical protein